MGSDSGTSIEHSSGASEGRNNVCCSARVIHAPEQEEKSKGADGTENGSAGSNLTEGPSVSLGSESTPEDAGKTQKSAAWPPP